MFDLHGILVGNQSFRFITVLGFIIVPVGCKADFPCKLSPFLFVHGIEHDAEHVPGEVIISGVCRDPKDDIFIACAVEGKSDVIVSGDTDLLDMGTYEGISIVSPRQFLDLLAES